MMVQTSKKIEKNLQAEDFNLKLTEEFQAYICKNNSQWILYTQEALQYGFDIVKMIELELVFEFIQELHDYTDIQGDVES